jgi:glycosyltransferase involved in cell wall biosynthesis
MQPSALYLARERARHEHARLALERVLADCREGGIDVLPVKGVLTAYLWYPDVGLRPIQDVDLRVRPDDLDRVERVGTRAGWRPLGRSWAYGTLAFDVLGFLVEFESHVGPPGLCGLRVDDMLRRALPRADVFRVPHLEPELHDHALLLCVNAFKDKLIDALPGGVRDLELVPEQAGFSQERLVALARESGVVNITWIVASWLAQARGSGPWRDIRERLGRKAPRPLYTFIFERALRVQSPQLLRVLARAGPDRPMDRLRAVSTMVCKPFSAADLRGAVANVRLARGNRPLRRSDGVGVFERDVSRGVGCPDVQSPPMSLRICHLGKFYPPAPGGVETHVQTLARAQARLGATVRVICVNHRGAGGKDLTWQAFGSTPSLDELDRGVRVTRLARSASFSRLDLCPGLLSTLWQLRREQIDVVHVHAPNPTMFLALALLPTFPTLVVTHHGDVVKQRLLGRLFAPLERRVHDRSALVLSDSEAYVGGSAVLQRLATKVRALPLGLDLTPFLQPTAAALACEAQLRTELGQPLWLTVGRLVYYKGLATAIDALARLPGRLLVIGTGPMEGELRARAKARGVDDRIEWAGHVHPDRLIGAYRAATALWFPSNARSEGFGLVQVEAMASGSPVINTDIPHSGVAWVSRDGESGLTIPVNDSGALVAASRRLLAEPGLRNRLSGGAIARAKREFDDMAMARRSLELYAQVRDRSAERLNPDVKQSGELAALEGAP